MTIDKQKLKALAEASPYKDWSLSSYEAVGGRAHIVMHGAFDHIITTFEEGSAEFIAAASPSTVLALLAEIERTEGRLHDVSVLCATVEQERDQLKAENEALRKDAERYRGVRRVANRQGFTDEQFDQQTDTRIASFDEAMAKEASQ